MTDSLYLIAQTTCRVPYMLGGGDFHAIVSVKKAECEARLFWGREGGGGGGGGGGGRLQSDPCLPSTPLPGVSVEHQMG